MSQDQRYEYRTINVEERSFEGLKKKLDELAQEGWRLIETAESNGRTVKFILERPCE